MNKLSLIVIIIILALLNSSVNAKRLLLSGKVEDVAAQSLTTPWTPTWRAQIKWLAEEGTKVKAGDVVVRFDVSDLTSQIEQQESTLRRTEQQAEEAILKKVKAYEDANFDRDRKALLFKKAKLEADVPKRFRSDYEYAQFQFELLKAEDELKRAEELKSSSFQALQAEKEKQKISIQLIKNELDKVKRQLDGMDLKSAINGTVFHTTHPWNGNKIQEGETLQTTMTAAKVSGGESMIVRAWVNEVDYSKIKINQLVVVTFDSNLALKVPGKISGLNSQAEKKRQWGVGSWYAIDVLIEPSQVVLRPGMSALVEVSLEELP